MPLSEMRQPIAKDSIPAIVDPAFTDDWGGLETDGDAGPSLPDDAAVVGVTAVESLPDRLLDVLGVVAWNGHAGGLCVGTKIRNAGGRHSCRI